jgi:hypothetical protein
MITMQLQIIRLAVHGQRTRHSRNARKFSVANFEGSTSLGRHRRKWEGNIEVEIKGCGRRGCGLDFSGLG